MPGFILHAFDDGFISEEEFLILYDVNTLKNLDLPYWNYKNFDLDSLSDDECKGEKRHIHSL